MVTVDNGERVGLDNLEQSDFIQQIKKLTKEAALSPQVAMEIELSIDNILKHQYDSKKITWKCYSCGFEPNDGNYCKNCGCKAQ